MQVMKFGGTSVANAENMLKVADIVCKAAASDRLVVVASAISKCTDTLIRIGQLASVKDAAYAELIDELQQKHHVIIEDLLPAGDREPALRLCDAEFEALKDIARGVSLLGELSPASLDAIQGFGELFSTRILATKLACCGLKVKWLDSRKIITTENVEGKNVVDTELSYKAVAETLAESPDIRVFVAPGFIASDASGKVTTLGRGGSDYTASLFAVGCKADRLEIWTDVPGMMTSNPKIVPTARTIRNISYRAALELSHFGAKVIYPPTIQPVVATGIPILVKDTFHPDEAGTLIEQNPANSGSGLIGISNSDNIALLSLEGSGMVGVPGFTSRLFAAFSRSGINIILITQASSVHTMCIAVSEADAEKARIAADSCFAYEISLGKINPLKVEKGYSIVCLVADDILSNCGATGRLLATLGARSIPIRATAQGSSERNISVIVRSDYVNTAIRSIHNEFFDKSTIRELNLFIAGYGTVGKALVKMIAENRDGIVARCGKHLNIIALSNSRKYIFNPAGLNLKDIPAQLEAGKDTTDGAFFKELSSHSFENSIFVDCTASPVISSTYEDLFREGYSVVACNKIAFSAEYERFARMKVEAVAHGVSLRYETTAGAALPVIESVERCVNSGDRIHHIEAVLSGTLSFIFSTYNGRDGVSFAQVVRTAQDSGYTEPDPRLDLSGRDMLRKLLIISREAGVPLEEKDVAVTPILDDSFFEGSVEDFYAKLSSNEDYFSKLSEGAVSQGRKLMYVATLDQADDGTFSAALGLKAVSDDSPLYQLRGTDNAVIIASDFYPSPYLIQGAGAGSSQTASGLLNDILID